MRMFLVAVFTAFFALTTGCSEGKDGPKKDTNRKGEANVPVQIAIIADSSNSISAQLSVTKSRNARDVMNSCFKMEYASNEMKFVTGIAGFVADKAAREYWALEVDGKRAKVGIADINLDRPMQIEWRLQNY